MLSQRFAKAFHLVIDSRLEVKASIYEISSVFRYSILVNQSLCSLLPVVVITPTLEVLRQVCFVLIIVKFSLYKLRYLPTNSWICAYTKH